MESSFLVKAFWMDEEDELETLKECIHSLPTWNSKYAHHLHMAEFQKHKAKSLIYTSNKLEATIPLGASQNSTYKILEAFFVGSQDEPHFQDQRWQSESSTDQHFPCQLYHHFKAYEYLCITQAKNQSPLTLEILLKTHQLLMENCEAQDGDLIANGRFRNHAVYADTYVYMRHEDVPEEVNRIIEDFNMKLQTKCNPIILAADLFYDLITAHPFEDGNGRICRLLAAYAFLVSGTPFPVPITTGHKKSRNHYMKAILKARRHNGDRKLLYTLFANSLELAWSNAMNYCKINNV